MIAGARVEVAPFKEDPMDFVLWKPSSAQEPGWNSPWGRGRPGWHIECSAMAYELLGDTFDIHGGGLDLQFPHHENELAQSACAHPEGGFAQVWMHNEMLQVEGKKMSKSLGNFFTVRDLLDKGYAGEVIRFVMLSTHYRKPMDWTEAKAREATHTLTSWYRATDNVTAATDIPKDVIDILANDVNTSGAIAEMHGLASREDWAGLKAAMRLLGLPDAEQVEWFRQEAKMASFDNLPDTSKLFGLMKRWQDLRNARKFEEADWLKQRIEDCGVKLSVSVAGPEATRLDTFNPAKLDALL
jgi:cysteinyl-tRNA synthetase